ncbi:hypothetical protein C7447_101778 [Tenacibaculum adriaticum]|uniref:Uncharacterized protein n=1 Tax=Tenacibaculum adriaticum TaxID=413713 RepID=A0A5S5DW40_9FLAO|nr:hypothetical protein [Tenacibaculum adriaticum]TYQ00168.1 hypothetical protein C7447_101778 [Tenacibaculum adriaticum]
MIEVFTTNIQDHIQVNCILKILENSFPVLKFNFDLEDFKLPYPCNHSILRVEGKLIHTESIITILDQLGYQCDILEDKVCN